MSVGAPGSALPGDPNQGSNPLSFLNDLSTQEFGFFSQGFGTAIGGGIDASRFSANADLVRLMGNFNAEATLRRAADAAKRSERSAKAGIGAIVAQMAANGLQVNTGSNVDVLDAEIAGYAQRTADILTEGQRQASMIRLSASSQARSLDLQAKNAMVESVLGGAVGIGMGFHSAGVFS